MASFHWVILQWVALFAAHALSVDIVYVTDIQIFTLLAPCISSAVSYQIASQTLNSRCSDEKTALQACVCANSNALKQVTSSMNVAIASSCGTFAGSSDLSSASMVVDKYCNPDKAITFSTPTTNIVNAFITELPELSALPPCAQSGLSYAVADMSSNCPTDASLYAPCVCNTDRAKIVTDSMSKYVRNSCTNDEDVTAAQGFFKEYCAMNDGTTSFAGPQSPPGDMTYYITALPQYKSLRPCAQSALSSAVLGQSAWICGSDPQAFASCACLKSGVKGKISGSLTSSVKGYCDVTAIDDVTSAVSVWDYYCSAAEKKVVATVSESISMSSRTQRSTSLPSETGAGGNSGDEKGSEKVNRVAIIAASVLGAVVAIILIAALVWFLRRRSRRKQREQLQSDGVVTNGIDPKQGANPSVVTPMPELSTPSYTPELYGHASSPPSELPPHHWVAAELHGDGINAQPAQAPHQYSGSNTVQVSRQSPNQHSHVSPSTASP